MGISRTLNYWLGIDKDLKQEETGAMSVNGRQHSPAPYSTLSFSWDTTCSKLSSRYVRFNCLLNKRGFTISSEKSITCKVHS